MLSFQKFQRLIAYYSADCFIDFEMRMTSSATLDLSLQLLRQPSVTPVDHNCQNIMAERLKNWFQH